MLVEELVEVRARGILAEEDRVMNLTSGIGLGLGLGEGLGEGQMDGIDLHAVTLMILVENLIQKSREIRRCEHPRHHHVALNLTDVIIVWRSAFYRLRLGSGLGSALGLGFPLGLC